jgi:uncharacterized protein YigA (DUF484 family)
LDRTKDSPRAADRPNAAAETRESPHDVTAAEVAAYLRKHPDFLTEHPDLLATLTPPEHQRGDGVLDMQYFMLQRLKADVARLKGQQRALIATTRSNLSSQARIHAAVLAIISATSFEQLLQVVTTDLAAMLDVDVVTIGVESPAGNHVRMPLSGIQLLRPGTVDALLGSERDVLLRAGVEGDPGLFGSGAGLVRSLALLRINVAEHAPMGLLCIGTRKPDKFHAGQGTELLGFLARALETTLGAWLDIAA